MLYDEEDDEKKTHIKIMLNFFFIELGRLASAGIKLYYWGHLICDNEIRKCTFFIFISGIFLQSNILTTAEREKCLFFYINLDVFFYIFIRAKRKIYGRPGTIVTFRCVFVIGKLTRERAFPSFKGFDSQTEKYIFTFHNFITRKSPSTFDRSSCTF